MISNPAALAKSGGLNVSLQDLLSAPANGVIAADAVRLVRKAQPLKPELLTLNNNPLDNLALEYVSTTLIPAIEDRSGTTAWKELSYSLNPNAPTIGRTTPISTPIVETSIITSLPGYVAPIAGDVDGGGVTFSYASDSRPRDVNAGSRYFSGDDAVVLPDTLQKYSASEVAFEFWFSTTNKGVQTILSAVGTNLLRIGTQLVAGWLYRVQCVHRYFGRTTHLV